MNFRWQHNDILWTTKPIMKDIPYWIFLGVWVCLWFYCFVNHHTKMSLRVRVNDLYIFHHYYCVSCQTNFYHILFMPIAFLSSQYTWYFPLLSTISFAACFYHIMKKELVKVPRIEIFYPRDVFFSLKKSHQWRSNQNS